MICYIVSFTLVWDIWDPASKQTKKTKSIRVIPFLHDVQVLVLCSWPGLRQLSLWAKPKWNSPSSGWVLSCYLLSAESSGKCHRAQIDIKVLKERNEKINFVRVLNANQESFPPRNLPSERIKTKTNKQKINTNIWMGKSQDVDIT